MSNELAPRFDPSAIERDLYERWSREGYFHVPAGRVLEGDREPFVIVIPPPNVTAVLHMGHGLNNTIQDVLIRWRRMQGRPTEWLPGTDHAGIATQNVVERQLADEGLSRHDLGRDAFVDRVWTFVEETGSTILDQLKAIGCSCDWDRTAFTLDPHLSRAVREVFVRLHEKGLIYRGEYIINWCPRCHTALSNEEAEGEETQGRLWHLRYPLAEASWGAASRARSAGAKAVEQGGDGRWFLTVSTTRPETMLGDTGVAVHPDDERYEALVGADVHLPLTGRTIPVVADAFVDPEFGTGMVKVTPAHDPNDFEIAGRTDLEVLDVMTEEAALNENAPERFRGMDRFEARTAVLEALKEEGLYAGEDEHTHSVPHCYRCDTVVEPRLSMQWFVKMKPLAEPALRASRDGTITFTPDRHRKVYEHWMENIRDWCISRQLWWGHRIPVWYCDCGETVVAREDPDACPACGSEEIVQDEDVLDTWFSSWLWPFSPFGWPEETDDLEAFYPGHVLSTAPEILFFWVARMIMAGYEFMGEPPFTDVYLHATVRDKYGRKMSKSLGNGIDPLDVVERFGADALRYTVLSSAAVGTDIRLDHEDLEAAFAPGRNFANKIWNAGRFTLMSVEDAPVRTLEEVADDLELADRWILSRLDRTVESVTEGLERFRLHEVCEELRTFFWNELADWYLELVKTRLWGEEGDASREAARTTLVTVFDRVMRLLHPVVPFVTAALWDRLPWPGGATADEDDATGDGDHTTDDGDDATGDVAGGDASGGRSRPVDLIVAPWPKPGELPRDEEAEARLDALQELVTSVRSLRKEYNVGEGERVTVSIRSGSEAFRDAVEGQLAQLDRLARIEEVRWADPDGGPGAAAGDAGAADRGIGAHDVLSGGAELFLPLEGVVDLDRERARLRDEIDNLEERLAQTERKLDNEQFVNRAPDEIVDRERDKAASQRDQLGKLRGKLALLEGRG